MAEMGKENFRKPPLVETVLGVQFTPLKRMTNSHLALMWQALRPDWNGVIETQPLAFRFERFDDAGVWNPEAVAQFQADAGFLAHRPQLRLQVKAPGGDRMLQLQNGRLHYNWIRQPKGEYPRYQTVLPEFLELTDKASTFLRSEGIGDLVPNQWEITYLNNIARGTAWQDRRDWNELFRSGMLRCGSFGIDGVDAGWSFEIPPKKGRLHVEVRSGNRSDDNTEIVVLRMTARGPMSESRLGEPLQAALDLGHDAILEAFREVVSEEALAYWRA